MPKPNLNNPADKSTAWTVDGLTLTWNPANQSFDLIKDGLSMPIPRDMAQSFFRNFEATEAS